MTSRLPLPDALWNGVCCHPRMIMSRQVRLTDVGFSRYCRYSILMLGPGLLSHVVPAANIFVMVKVTHGRNNLMESLLPKRLD